MKRASANRVAGVGDDAVKKATGKTWAQWLRILDASGARSMSHQEIVAFLVKEHGLAPWWRQMVTVGYEQASGLRQKHEKPDGFQVSRSKTIGVALTKAFVAWDNEGRRRAWLADPGLTIRKATRNKSLRTTWIDGKSSLEIFFSPKGATRTQVVVQHSKLKSAAASERMKRYWAEQLQRLESHLRKA